MNPANSSNGSISDIKKSSNKMASKKTTDNKITNKKTISKKTFSRNKVTKKQKKDGNGNHVSKRLAKLGIISKDDYGEKCNKFSLSCFIEYLIGFYTSFLSRRPMTMLMITVFFIIAGLFYSGQVQSQVFSPEDAIPDDIPVIASYERFGDEFGSVDSAMIVVELTTQAKGSTELRDIRHPDIVDYLDKLSAYLENSRHIKSISKPSDILKQTNNGKLPRYKNKLRDIIDENPLLGSYFSDDEEMARITLSLYENYDDDDLIKDMEDAIDYIPEPVGIDAKIAGGVVAETVAMRQIGPDMAKTSNLALAGIVVVLIVIFGSIKFGLLPLTTIAIGVLWTFGYLGFIGKGINSATSGVLSMIIGIGIDFGIQIISRYRQELAKGLSVEDAMKNSLDNTMFPMLITTIAAVIGFASMSMGQLSVMKDIGDMMTYGVIFCYLAAITFVPSITLLLDKITQGAKKTFAMMRADKKKF